MPRIFYKHFVSADRAHAIVDTIAAASRFTFDAV